MMSRSFRRIRSFVTTMLVCIMVIGGLAAPASTSAQNQTVQSQLTGVTISYGPQYTIQPDSVYEPNTMEMMMFIGPADILAVGFMSPMLDINSARDIILESLIGAGFSTQSIDRGDYSGVSYSLDMMNLEGVEMGVFTLFLSGRSHGYSEFYIFMAPPSLFASTMQNAQNSFTVDGAQLMNGVDANVMGNMVVANQGITGGTSATDVEVVTGDDSNGTEVVPTEATTAQTTTTTETTTGGADRDAYLASVQAEYETATAELAAVINALNGMRDEELTPEESFAIIEASTAVLAGTSNRVAGIQAPAGMEGFHQEFVAWAADISAAGTGWATTKQTGNVDDFNTPFEKALATHSSFGATLEAELASTGTATEETTQTTTTETTTGGMDRESYLAAVQEEFGTVDNALAEMLGAFVEANTGEIDMEDALPTIDAAAVIMAGTNDRIANIQPPAGMEAFHAEFVAWADDVTTAGTAWSTAVQTGDAVPFNDAFSVAMDTHVGFSETLSAELENTGSSTDVQTETATEEATETTRTTRTSRTATTGDTDPTAEATETSRTRRSGSSTGNSSETGGRTSTTRTSSSSGSADRGDYLEAVRAEYDLVSENLTIIQDMLQQLSEGTVDDSVAIQAINDANVELANAETRIADLEAPEGLEAFHEDFLDWSESVVGVGESWNAFVNGEIDAEAYVDVLLLLVEDTITFGDLLEDEEAAGSIGNMVAAISTREMMAA